MINIFEFLKRFQVQLLFALLLILGLYITSLQKNYQRIKFLNSANSISGGAFSVVSNISDYLDLKSKNKALAHENAKLRAQIPSALKKVNGDYFTISDSLYKQKFIYRVSNVISNSYTSPSNIITLDLGKKDGVIEEMGVIAPAGVVGIVGAVTENYCSVISFLHPKTVISCKLQSNGVAGLLKWTGGDIAYAEIKDIPITTKITAADTVLTSGFSSVFPAGITLGTVKSFEKDLENQSQKVIVSLKLNFAALNQVYIVENLFKTELEQLNNKAQTLSNE